MRSEASWMYLYCSCHDCSRQWHVQIIPFSPAQIAFGPLVMKATCQPSNLLSPCMRLLLHCMMGLLSMPHLLGPEAVPDSPHMSLTHAPLQLSPLHHDKCKRLHVPIGQATLPSSFVSLLHRICCRPPSAVASTAAKPSGRAAGKAASDGAASGGPPEPGTGSGSDAQAAALHMLQSLQLGGCPAPYLLPPPPLLPPLEGVPFPFSHSHFPAALCRAKSLTCITRKGPVAGVVHQGASGATGVSDTLFGWHGFVELLLRRLSLPLLQDSLYEDLSDAVVWWCWVCQSMRPEDGP